VNQSNNLIKSIAPSRPKSRQQSEPRAQAREDRHHIPATYFVSNEPEAIRIQRGNPLPGVIGRQDATGKNQVREPRLGIFSEDRADQLCTHAVGDDVWPYSDRYSARVLVEEISEAHAVPHARPDKGNQHDQDHPWPYRFKDVKPAQK